MGNVKECSVSAEEMAAAKAKVENKTIRKSIDEKIKHINKPISK